MKKDKETLLLMYNAIPNVLFVELFILYILSFRLEHMRIAQRSNIDEFVYYCIQEWGDKINCNVG